VQGPVVVGAAGGQLVTGMMARSELCDMGVGEVARWCKFFKNVSYLGTCVG
jgi:hypothetical protein